MPAMAECPKRDLRRLAVFAAFLAVVILAVGVSVVNPFAILAAVLIVQAILSAVIIRTVRRRRAKSGSCLSCTHSCQFRLDGSAPEPASEPVPVRITSRPEWTGNAHVWNELKAYDARRFSDG